MPFAPHEIENKRFVRAFRGYRTDEVESFLRAVAADYRTALEAAAGGEVPAELRRLESVLVERLEALERACLSRST
jgi:DivIVA domain-containing protein